VHEVRAEGRYSVAKLIERYGRDGNMQTWRASLSADCPKRDAFAIHERCDIICPDLPKAKGCRAPCLSAA
jgi:hypothetical protein